MFCVPSATLKRLCLCTVDTQVQGKEIAITAKAYFCLLPPPPNLPQGGKKKKKDLGKAL